MNNELLYVAITRFGSIAFVIFSVSVLLRVYQYLMKLAAYYDSRADAIELMKTHTLDDADIMVRFANILSAERIDFGRSLKTPIDSVVEILKSKNNGEEK